MSDGYYPKYYRKKRQRDGLYRRIWSTIGWVVVIGMGIVVGTILYNQFSPGKWGAANPGELATMKEDLETQQRVEDALEEPRPVNDDDAAEVELKFEGKLEELEYASSMPSVHVGIEKGSGTASADPHEVEPNENIDVTGVDESDSIPGNAGEPAEAETPPPPPPAQTPERTAQEPENPGNSSTVEPVKPKKEPEKPKEPAVEEPVQPNTPRYHVYAGIYHDRDSAVARKKDLNVLGFPGSIMENGGDYFLLVTEVSTSEEAVVLEKKLEGGGFPEAFRTRKMK